LKKNSATVNNWNPIPSIVEWKRIPFFDEECWLAQEIELEYMGFCKIVPLVNYSLFCQTVDKIALQVASESVATGVGNHVLLGCH
jgi:hypothetical protein